MSCGTVERGRTASGDVRPLIVWDWNGTLLDDLDAAVSALNRMLADRGCAPTTRDYYRAHFGFPVRPFYAELGVDLKKWDWGLICTDFHRFFMEAGTQKIRDGAREALEKARAAGFRQGIVSAHRQDWLRRDVAAAGIDGYFDFVAGTDNLDGASKLERARQLFAEDRSDAPRIFIGDTLHDAEVAADVGGQCVLVSCGHQTRERLMRTGRPIASNLQEAVDVAISAFRPSRAQAASRPDS